MTGDDHGIEWCRKAVMGEKRLLQLQGGRGIFLLGADQVHICLRHRQVGARHVFVALRLFGPLRGGHVAPHQALLPPVGCFALRQLCACPVHGGTGLGEVRRIGCHHRPGAGYARLLLGRMECRQFLAFGNPVAGIGGERTERRTSLETDPAQHPRLHGAQTIDAQGNARLRSHHRHAQRPFHHEQHRRPDRQHRKRPESPKLSHGSASPRLSP